MGTLSCTTQGEARARSTVDCHAAGVASTPTSTDCPPYPWAGFKTSSAAWARTNGTRSTRRPSLRVRRSSTRRVHGTVRATRSRSSAVISPAKASSVRMPKKALSSESPQRKEFTKSARPSR